VRKRARLTPRPEHAARRRGGADRFAPRLLHQTDAAAFPAWSRLAPRRRLKSGIGREFSLEGMLDSFMQRKNVTVNLNV
jgi:hypothetical protein